MIYLAERREDGPVPLHEIASRVGIPKAFLSKILQQLGRGGIVRSLKGPTGGFALARDPRTLTVRDIVVEIDGPLKVFECFSGGERDCTHFGNCKILAVFDNVGSEIERVLNKVTLADFVNGDAPVPAKAPMPSLAATVK